MSVGRGDGRTQVRGRLKGSEQGKEEHGGGGGQQRKCGGERDCALPAE